MEVFMKINYKDMYLGRIDQINIDIKQAIYSKKWALKAKLESEKKIVEGYIKKLG
jgi:DNA-binding GntR family transcriptional regulator